MKINRMTVLLRKLCWEVIRMYVVYSIFCTVSRKVRTTRTAHKTLFCMGIGCSWHLCWFEKFIISYMKDEKRNAWFTTVKLDCGMVCTIACALSVYGCECVIPSVGSAVGGGNGGGGEDICVWGGVKVRQNGWQRWQWSGITHDNTSSSYLGFYDSRSSDYTSLTHSHDRRVCVTHQYSAKENEKASKSHCGKCFIQCMSMTNIVSVNEFIPFLSRFYLFSLSPSTRPIYDVCSNVLSICWCCFLCCYWRCLGFFGAVH